MFGARTCSRSGRDIAYGSLVTEEMGHGRYVSVTYPWNNANGGNEEGQLVNVENQQGLPLNRLEAVLFDLDGVLTDTARLHEQAWTEVFLPVLTAAEGSVRPFTDDDYVRLVDGEAPLDGVRHVLADRNMGLPVGDPQDPAGNTTAWAIVNAKDARYHQVLVAGGPHPFASSIQWVQAMRAAGLETAVVSASRHCREILAMAHITDLFDAVIDGESLAAMQLAGKPNPAAYQEAAARVGVEPSRAAIFEDAVAGVQAGHRGGFGFVVGVDRRGHPDTLMKAGADIVVSDLAELQAVGVSAAASGWRREFRGDDAANEGRREALTTLANGYLGTRGARNWVADDGTHYPGTYLAGVYNRRTDSVHSRQLEQEAIVNVPNWLPLRFSIEGGPWLGDPALTICDHRVWLDLRGGLLIRQWRVIDPQGRSSVLLERRLVSMANPHLAASAVSLVAENWSGRLCWRSELDASTGDHQTLEERLVIPHHWVMRDHGETPDHAIGWLTTETPQSRILVVEASRTRLVRGHEDARRFVQDDTHVMHEITTSVIAGGRVSVEKVVAFYTTHDRAISDPLGAAQAAAQAADGFSALSAAHQAAWARIWRHVPLKVETDPPSHPDFVSETVNLHRFHLLQTTSPHVMDCDVGIPARGLAGEGYLGHIFWDEVFVFPVLNLRFAEAARALFLYRWRRLDAARKNAADSGFRGAMFPWQSGSDGREDTPPILYNARAGHWMPDRSYRQRHVGLAIAYEWWHYWETTGDTPFFFQFGAEIFLEVARFFASLATFDPMQSRWHICGVMGPDEFHDHYPGSDRDGVDDNAYTNVMTAWVLRRARQLIDRLATTPGVDLLDRLGLTAAEWTHWEELTRTLFVPFHEGVMSQFAGYERLATIDLTNYRQRYGYIGRLDLILDAEGDAVSRYQVAKQADVLMLFYLLSVDELREILGGLGYELSADTIQRTIAYYASRAVHGSTLSAVVYAWVMARADRVKSWTQFQAALAADVADTQGGTTREGIHLGAMAGTIDLLQRCYTGLEVREDALWLNPCLPPEIGRIQYGLTYRGHTIDIAVDGQQIAVTAAPSPALPVTVMITGKRMTLVSGQRLLVPWN